MLLLLLLLLPLYPPKSAHKQNFRKNVEEQVDQLAMGCPGKEISAKKNVRNIKGHSKENEGTLCKHVTLCNMFGEDILSKCIAHIYIHTYTLTLVFSDSVPTLRRKVKERKGA